MIPKKGFTLIELLVVIGILAILATATAVILNPAELLRQSRDSTRIADMASLANAIDLYLTDVTNPSIGSASFCTKGAVTKGTAACTERTGRTVDGTGTPWVTINFTSISAGTPIARLPMDPNNGNTACDTATPGVPIPKDNCFYQYIPDSTNNRYELNTSMESVKFRSGGTGDVEGTDGGTSTTAYEVGNDPGLDL